MILVIELAFTLLCKKTVIIASYEKKLSYLQVTINYKHADLIPQIRKHVVIVKIDYEDNLIRLDLRMPPSGKEKVQDILKHANQAACYDG